MSKAKDPKPCNRDFVGATTLILKDGVTYCPRCGWASKEHKKYLAVPPRKPGPKPFVGGW